MNDSQHPPAAPKSTGPAEALRRCGSCRHFCNDPELLECQLFPGLSSLGSGRGSVKAQDGVCSMKGLYLSFYDLCPEFSAA